MKTHVIPDKVRAKVDLICGVPLKDPKEEAERKANKDNIIKALESGKTVYIGGHKFRGEQVEKPETVKPPGPSAKTDGKPDKDQDKV